MGARTRRANSSVGYRSNSTPRLLLPTQAQWRSCKRDIVDRYATSSDLHGALQLLSVIAPIAGLWVVISLAAPG